MTAHARIADFDQVRRSVRVRTVAEILDCDESQVRRLVAERALEAHPFGKRGIRVYLDSVTDYQLRGAKPKERAKRPTPAGRRAHLHAVAELRAKGIL